MYYVQDEHVFSTGKSSKQYALNRLGEDGLVKNCEAFNSTADIAARFYEMLTEKGEGVRYDGITCYAASGIANCKDMDLECLPKMYADKKRILILGPSSKSLDDFVRIKDKLASFFAHEKQGK